MTAFRVRLLLAFFATGAVIGQSIPAHATSVDRQQNVCEALRLHVPLVDIESSLEATGLSQWSAGWWAGVQILAQCPEMAARVSQVIA